ncbi:spore coat protein GerQ [Neobacillus piezotolerans]|uniref:Spore coat protein GerQ n=1 Tax=Neobacillus piezotolerans TaxID=2259171 RepID=A0A3D8GTR0_9BACI|nr:spore coat protein GerQ [Neobacillus piezotolerans]RDU37436.1 spore coat protein GerQ [Neobacillus piezotolerans]
MNPYGNYGTGQQGYQPYTGTGGVPVSPDQRQQQQPMGGGQMGGYPMGTGTGGFVPIPHSAPTTGPQVPGMLPIEQSYIENILRLNKGKLATVYMTFEGTRDGQRRQQVFKGIIEAAGRDHIILSDPQTGTRYLLLMVYLDYISFDEEIEYTYPFPGGGAGLSSFSPR